MNRIVLLLLPLSALTACHKKSDLVSNRQSKAGWKEEVKYDEQHRVTEWTDKDGVVFHNNGDGSITKTLPDGSSVTIRDGKEEFRTGPRKKE